MLDLASLVDGLGPIGQRLIERFGALNAWTALLLVGALLLDHLLSRRVRAAWRIAFYAPLALRIVLPLGWSLHLAGAPRLDAFVAPLVHVDAGASVGSPTWRALAYAPFAVYVGGLALLAAHALRARRRLSRALEGAMPVEPAELPSGAPCPVVVHDELGPMVVGLRSPRIVLPRHLLEPEQGAALACVLRHEAAHVDRGDAWLQATMQMLAVVAWPVLPLWLATARVRQLVELACDEAALAGADAAERRRYGHALLDLAESQSFAVVPTAAGDLQLVRGWRSTLRARITALAAQKQWPVAAQAFALCAVPALLFTVAAACSGTTGSAATASATGEALDQYGYRFETDPASTTPAGSAAADAARGPNGRLPPETIQSVVRSNFGRFRSCYEAGLQRDPKLAGTVTVAYTIAVDGSTEGPADQGSTMPDRAVVACVVAGFGELTYPRPEGGIVTVVYPIQFSP